MAVMAINRILVVGAGGPVGFEITRGLLAEGLSVKATYRTHRPTTNIALTNLGAEIAQLDLDNHDSLKQHLADVDAAIFVPILNVSQNAAAYLRNDQRAVFFSSNNVGVTPEGGVYAQLLAAEGAVRNAAPQSTILRPTMIYGYPGDGNMSRLMTVMRKYPFAPMPGSGAALQQPVYYKDLAQTAVHALLQEPPFSGIAAVAGPTALTQRALYAAVAKAGDASPIIIRAPLGPAAFVARTLEGLGVKSPLSSAQLARAAMDKTPTGDRVILTKTSLENGLKALAASLDGQSHGA